MANVGKKDGGQGGQGQQGQAQPGQQGQGQQGQQGGQQLMRRDPFQQLMGGGRDPFQMLMRDPLQLMREMMVDPFRMFSQFPSAFLGREMVWSPQFEIRERDDAFVFKADMPGIRVEDLDISLVGNQLQITGKREQEREEGEGQYYAYERSYGNFTRTFSLPESADMDNIKSDLKDGELTLIVPKKAGAQPQRRKIQISAGSKS